MSPPFVTDFRPILDHRVDCGDLSIRDDRLGHDHVLENERYPLSG